MCNIYIYMKIFLGVCDKLLFINFKNDSLFIWKYFILSSLLKEENYSLTDLNFVLQTFYSLYFIHNLILNYNMRNIPLVFLSFSPNSSIYERDLKIKIKNKDFVSKKITNQKWLSLVKESRKLIQLQ